MPGLRTFVKFEQMIGDFSLIRVLYNQEYFNSINFSPFKEETTQNKTKTSAIHFFT